MVEEEEEEGDVIRQSPFDGYILQAMFLFFQQFLFIIKKNVWEYVCMYKTLNIN